MEVGWLEVSGTSDAHLDLELALVWCLVAKWVQSWTADLEVPSSGLTG